MKKHLKRILSIFLAGAITVAFVPDNRLAPNLTGALAAPFTDVAGHPSEAAIARWAQLGVVRGDGGRAFPDRPAMRVEFVAAMNRVLRVAVNNWGQRFDDVTSDAWYYDDVQRAYAAGLAIGVGNNRFAPEQRLNREMMVTMMGRIFGLYSENTSILGDIYADETEATYGRGHLAAFAEMGVTMAVDGYFEPRRTVTRSEMFQFINDFLPHVYIGTDIYSGRTTTGNMIIRSPSISLDSVTLNGSLILADGIEDGSISIRNSIINGRLIIRGGGPDSINLTGTIVTEGVYVYNRYCDTRIFSTNSQTKIGEIIAMTAVTIEGAGFSTLRIPIDAVQGGPHILRDVALDSLNVERAGAYIELESTAIDNVRFAASANGGVLDIAKDARVSYLEINADNIRVTGEGSIDYLVIKGDNANIAMQPRFVTIAPGLTATVNGAEIKGSEVDARGTLNNVTRNTPELDIRRDIANTGGGTLTLSTTAGTMGNTVTVTPDASSAVQLTDQSRLGYWLGFFIPAPPRAQNPAVKIGYDFEGGEDYVFSIPFASQNAVRGILVYIPVKAGADLTGSIDTSIYITWGNGLYETLNFKGHNFRLATPSSSQMTRMVNQFGNALYPSYNRIATFSGSEALKRLLLADNPLGLDVRSFDAFPVEEQNSFASQMHVDRASLTSKPAIQTYLNERITAMGGLFLVNGATTAAIMKDIIENDDFAGQLGINTLRNSDYGTLSDVGKLHVANTLVVERNRLATGKFPNEEAVATVFNNAVTARRRAEITLLTTINSTTDATAMQRLLETQLNANLIGIVTAADPYRALAAPQRLAVMTRIVGGRQYENLNGVRILFEELVGTPDRPVIIPPEENPNVTGIELNVNTLNLVVGSSENIIPTINTSSGSFSTLSSVVFSVNSSAIASVDDMGTVLARSRGRATVTVTSRLNSRIRATTVVNVVDPVSITALRITPPNVNVNVGAQVQLLLTVTPANGNDRVFWSVDHEDIAEVSSIGVVTGLAPGFTNVTARTASGVRTSISIFVSTDYASVAIEKPREGHVEIGLDGVHKLRAMVSPVTLSDQTVTWSSGSPTVALVDFDGTVRGVGIGTAIITATSRATGASAWIEVRVIEGKFGVLLDHEAVTMYRRGIFQLNASITPRPPVLPDPRLEGILWSVQGNRTDIVRVDQNGLVTAVGPGTATVTASYSGGDGTAFANCLITVLPDELRVTVRINGVVYNPARPPTINAGESFTMLVEFSPTPDNTRIDFRSSDETVATVDSNGRVTGVGRGTTIIHVTPQANNTPIPITVNVNAIAVRGISIMPSATLTVNKKSYTDLEVIFNPPDATNKNIIWGSNSPGIVSVTFDANNSSIAQIYAIESTFTTSTRTSIETVMVDNPNFNPIIPGSSPTSLTFPDRVFDDRQQIATETSIIITETVNNPVTITARSADGNFIATCLVTVEDRENVPVNAIDINLQQWVYQLGTTQQLFIRWNGGLSEPTNMGVTWSSGDPAIATVDRNGMLQTHRPGVTTVTATSRESGISSTKTIVVAPVGVSFIEFSGLDLRTQHGKWVPMTTRSGANARRITASVFAQATDRTLEWTSSNEQIVRVDQNGNLEARGPGVAVVTVRAVNTATYSAARPDGVGLLPGESINYSRSLLTGDTVPIENSTVFTNPNGETFAPDVPIPLVVNRPVVETFTVWVTEVELEGAVLQTPMPEIIAGNPVTISAHVVPGGARVDNVVWTITDTATNTVLSIDNQFPANGVSGDGRTSVSFTPPAGTTRLHIKVSATMNDLIQTTVHMPPSNAWLGASSGHVTVFGSTREAEAFVNVSSVPVASITGISADAASGTITAAISPPNASNRRITWSSSDTDIVEIENGEANTGRLIFGASTGTSIITATSADGGLTATIPLTINQIPAMLPISPFAQMSAAALPGFDPTATAPIPQSAIRELDEEEIPIAPTYLRIRSSARVLVGRNIRLYPNTRPANANQFIWETSDPSIAVVNGDGSITGISAGRVTITLTSADGKLSSRCTVHVLERNPRPSTNFRLSRTRINLNNGNSYKLDTFFSPRNASMQGINWYSTNPNVATVDVNGRVTAVSGGVSTIVAVTDEGRIARCTVTVRERVTSLRADVRRITLKAGDSQRINVTVLPENATTNVITWKSSNNNVATVSADGIIRAHRRGEATITASCDGRTATVTVTVTN
jgi:uncharacterized protein YjdB